MSRRDQFQLACIAGNLLPCANEEAAANDDCAQIFAARSKPEDGHVNTTEPIALIEMHNFEKKD